MTDDPTRVPPAPRTVTPAARRLVVNLGPGGVASLVWRSIASIAALVILRAAGALDLHRLFTDRWPMALLALPVIGLAQVGVAIRTYRRHRRAFVFGTPVVATLSSVTRGVMLLRGPSWALTWAFTGGDGWPAEGSVDLTRAGMDELRGNPKQGDRVVVLSDPADATVSTLWVE